MLATVLTIAGSDPTGGAGIQADLKTMTSIGVYGAAAITCITVQNSHGVVNIECLPSDLVYQQIRAVLDDHMVTHVKIGMVGNTDIAMAICDALTGFGGEVIYDPVMLASTGQPLMQEDTAVDMLHAIVSRCTVITPNIHELTRLSKDEIDASPKIKTSSVRLLEAHANLQAVVVKGGHGKPVQDMLSDFLFYRTEKGILTSALSHPRLQTQNTHGTGCTLASAFASYHSQCRDYSKAFQQSVRYVQSLLRESATERIIRNRDGAGSLLHYRMKG